MYAYLITHFIKFMSDICPNAEHGIDYRESMTSQAFVTIAYGTRTKLTWSGIWEWECMGAVVISDASGNYSYTFDIPKFAVNGNDFDNNRLINTLKKAITKKKIHYNQRCKLHLPKMLTNQTFISLQKYFSSSELSNFEGIYESTNPSKNNTQNKYVLAVRKINGKYYIIYLSGSNLYNDWQEGEVKAILTETSSPFIFKANWFMLDKSIDSDVYINFDNNLMTMTGSDGEKELFLKITTNSASTFSTDEQWSGTGFAIGNGYLVTNYHVVEKAKSIRVKGINGSFDYSYTATVAATDKNNDLAILKISDSKYNGFGTIPYRLKTSTSDVGEDVFVLGYPLTTTMGEEIKLTTGVISSKTGFQGDVSTYQISAPVQPGNSGGPLFDGKGNIIGVVSAKHVGTENVSYAVKASYLNNLVETISDGLSLPSNNTISTLSLSEKVKKVNDFVFLISCSAQPNP